MSHAIKEDLVFVKSSYKASAEHLGLVYDHIGRSRCSAPWVCVQSSPGNCRCSPRGKPCLLLGEACLWDCALLFISVYVCLFVCKDVCLCVFLAPPADVFYLGIRTVFSPWSLPHPLIRSVQDFLQVCGDKTSSRPLFPLLSLSLSLTSFISRMSLHLWRQWERHRDFCF